jgi:hypothetical protein
VLYKTRTPLKLLAVLVLLRGCANTEEIMPHTAPSLSATLEFEIESGVIRDLHQDGAERVYAAGPQLYIRTNGHWTDAPPLTKLAIHGVTSSAPGDVWAVGQGGLTLHGSGGTWQKAQLSDVLFDLIQVAAWPGRAWATASGEEIWQWDGHQWSSWEPPELLKHRVGAIWGLQPDAVFVEAHPMASGKPSSVGYWNGKDWTMTPLGKRGYITAICGTSKDDVWAVGYRVKLFGKGGEAFHFNGSTWSEVGLPVDVPLSDVVVRGENDVWVTGNKGTLLHWNGTKWTLVNTPLSGNLTSIVHLTDDEFLITEDARRIWLVRPTGD